MSSEDRSTGRVVVLVLPEVNLLDLGGPVQVFDAAAYQGADYRLEFVAADAGELTSARGRAWPASVRCPPQARVTWSWCRA